MVAHHDAEGFGNCTKHGECEARWPKAIPITFILWLNGEFRRAVLCG